MKDFQYPIRIYLTQSSYICLIMRITSLSLDFWSTLAVWQGPWKSLGKQASLWKNIFPDIYPISDTASWTAPHYQNSISACSVLGYYSSQIMVGIIIRYYFVEGVNQMEVDHLLYSETFSSPSEMTETNYLISRSISTNSWFMFGSGASSLGSL